MVRDVEVTHAHGEVDRVEIFEGGRKERHVGCQKDNCKNQDGQLAASEMPNAEC